MAQQQMKVIKFRIIKKWYNHKFQKPVNKRRVFGRESFFY